MRTLCYIISLLQLPPILAAAINPVLEIIDARCMDCHDAEAQKGGINLSLLMNGPHKPDPKLANLWLNVDRVVKAGEMPPGKKEPLTGHEKDTINNWFTQQFVLKNGTEHIGATPLRRLSRYELINTLEDLLHVSLKQPYVFSPEVPALLPSTLETILPADAPGESSFHNDAAQLAGSRPPILKYSEAFDYALNVFTENNNARETVFGAEPIPDALPVMDAVGEIVAKTILQRFTKRAWRGYHNPDNDDLIWRTYLKARKTRNPESALIYAMKICLMSPAFIYRMETTAGQNTPYPVKATELAVRLSYFLWSSIPDAELSALGQNRKLLEPEILNAQVQRLLNSPKRLSLAENFAGQWLGFSEIVSNRIFYRNENWNRGVYDEALFFFDELIKSDRPVLDIIDSDWVYKSNYTGVKTSGGTTVFPAKYDDIFQWRRQRPKGIRERFYDPPRLIKINSEQRGGLITSVGILRVTSAPEKTNPIRRGVWMLDKIIGRQLHAPENVPALSQSEKVNGKKREDLADIMKAHTSKAICVSCHKQIDPIGLGLENFDPFGKWRTNYPNRRAVKSNGTFPNGQTFETPREMKTILLHEYRELIVKNLTRRLLAYAIGRKLEPHDRLTVDRICNTLEKEKFKMSTLIAGIVNSPQFQKRQDSP
jgi:hypothetical protein